MLHVVIAISLVVKQHVLVYVLKMRNKTKFGIVTSRCIHGNLFRQLSNIIIVCVAHLAFQRHEAKNAAMQYVAQHVLQHVQGVNATYVQNVLFAVKCAKDLYVTTKMVK